MKEEKEFKVGDRVKVDGTLHGVIIAVFYHKVQVSLDKEMGVWLCNKKDIQMDKIEIKQNREIIRVWVCTDCKTYEINFNCEILYCSICGKEMEKRRFVELKLKKWKKKKNLN